MNTRSAPPQKASPAPPKGIVSPAARFRREIDVALADGTKAKDLVLRLTLSDANRLVRDPELQVDDIRFDAGAMHFLGVKVQQGGVAASVLEPAEA